MENVMYLDVSGNDVEVLLSHPTLYQLVCQFEFSL